MFKLENNRILSKDHRFCIEYKEALEKELDGTWYSYYCEFNTMVEIDSGCLRKCLRSIKRYKAKLRERSEAT